MTRHTRANWTAEQAEQVTLLWKAGLSPSQIAVRVGKTRNSVIGKIYRLGLNPSQETDRFYPMRRRPRPKEERLARMGVDRTPCPKCGVRADVGCSHTRPPLGFIYARQLAA